MAEIETTDILWVGIVTLLGCIMMARIARLVGNLRMKYKISPPETNGPPEFVRAMRAQQNSLEFFVVFIPILWVAGIFFHQIPAAIVGGLFLYHRYQYFHGYIQDAKLRVPPFKNSVQMLLVLAALSGVGLLNTAAVLYLRKDFLGSLARAIGLK